MGSLLSGSSSVARAMNFASVAASGASSSTISTATAQMSQSQVNGNGGGIVGSLGSIVSMGGKGLQESSPESDIPKVSALCCVQWTFFAIYVTAFFCSGRCVKGSRVPWDEHGLPRPENEHSPTRPICLRPRDLLPIIWKWWNDGSRVEPPEFQQPTLWTTWEHECQ